MRILGLKRAVIYAISICTQALCFQLVAEQSPQPPVEQSSLEEKSIEETFIEIYKNNVWGYNDQGEGISGGGSSVEATLAYRQFLQDFFKAFDIHSVVDAGCGDWEFSRAIDWTGINYMGFDVVPNVIAKNQQKYAKPMINFFLGNALTATLPEADLLICKDVLQHLNNQDVLDFIKKTADFKYSIIVNDVNHLTFTSSNPDIIRGEYRHIDLTKPPFSVKATEVFFFKMGDNIKQVVFISHAI